MWQQLKELYLLVRQMRDEGSWGARIHHVSRALIDGVRLFKGITDGTMGHREGRQYLQVGKFLERSSATASLLTLFVPERESASITPASIVSVAVGPAVSPLSDDLPPFVTAAATVAVTWPAGRVRSSAR